LSLERAGIETDAREFVRVDEFLRTSAPHVFAAGDVTGRMMLVPQAIQQGFVAATNAVQGPTMTVLEGAAPIGSFTDPEYAQVGMTETQARAAGDVIVAKVCFDSTTRTIIDGRTNGFCKLIVDRQTRQILGCHVVGERAVEVTQVAAVAMTGRMRVDDLARVPLSFPTYAGVLGRVAAQATRRLNLRSDWQAEELEVQ
jgi:dihydrolipoamide dehydrogenase